MKMFFRILSLFLSFSLFAIVTCAAGSSMQILVDPYTGSVYVESGEIVAPLYEGTFQLETRYIVGGLLANAINNVGQLVTKDEIPDLEDTVLQFWQNACCYANSWTCPASRESLKFGVSVKDTRDVWNPPKEYTLFHISHRALWVLGYCDAMRIPYYGARRAFVTQIGQLKILTVIRSIGLLQMTPGCPSSADFAIDVWVSIYPANVDLILQARRYPLWP